VDAPLGVTFDGATGTATFRVWAPGAGSASVVFLPAWNVSAPSATHPMTRDTVTGGANLDGAGWNGVWTATVTGVAPGQLYQYDLGGRRALDPYAPSMTRFDSSSQRVGVGAVLDLAAIAPRDVVTGADEPWVPFTRPDGYAKREDAVIYEVHVRDYTVSLPPGDLRHPPGTYEAFAERLGHVKALGATHVQLLPVLAYYFGDEGRRAEIETARDTTNNNYNWGYDPQSYFAPEGMYSADPEDPALRVKELRSLVNEAHARGLGVILDVVYNHTADTEILGALAPGYYYRGSSFSGVGNDTASERRMMRKLIVDSVRHWVAEYRVDGFRFDLMGLHDSETMRQAYQAARAVNPDVLFVGEGWRMGGVPGRDSEGNAVEPATQDWMDSTDDVSVFSDSFRDLMKGGGFGEQDPGNVGFLTAVATGRTIDKAQLLRNVRGDATNFTADDPGDVVQYLTAHDGLTLHDKLAKVLNLNPTASAATVHRVAGLGFVVQATSQGIFFLHGGCEMGRTKWVPGVVQEATQGNGRAFVYNSYDASDSVNAYDWSAWLATGSPGEALSRYLTGLLALRRSSDAFRLGARALATSNVSLLDGTQQHALAYRVVDAAGATAFHVFVNAGTSPVTLAAGADLRTGADLVVDDDEAGVTPVAAATGITGLTATTVTLAPRSAAVYRRALQASPAPRASRGEREG
jgi:secreted pullulanase